MIPDARARTEILGMQFRAFPALQVPAFAEHLTATTSLSRVYNSSIQRRTWTEGGYDGIYEGKTKLCTQEFKHKGKLVLREYLLRDHPKYDFRCEGYVYSAVDLWAKFLLIRLNFKLVNLFVYFPIIFYLCFDSYFF